MCLGEIHQDYTGSVVENLKLCGFISTPTRYLSGHYLGSKTGSLIIHQLDALAWYFTALRATIDVFFFFYFLASIKSKGRHEASRPGIWSRCVE